MKKKIQCQNELTSEIRNIRVRIIKAPLVDSAELNYIVYARAKALVL